MEKKKNKLKLKWRAAQGKKWECLSQNIYLKNYNVKSIGLIFKTR